MRIFLVVIVVSMMYANVSLAVDVVKVERPLSESDKRTLYKNAVLRAALDASTAEYGPYLFEIAKPIFSPARARVALVKGDLLNTYITSTTVAWEEAAIPVRFPIRKGLPGFRLVLIHKDDVSRFRNVNSIEDLKKFTGGTIGISSVTSTMHSHQFDVLTSSSFDGAFHMLAAKRFDFMSRGVNEVHREMNSGHPAFKDIVIAPDIALHIPLLSYIFISPEHPNLAKRFSDGLAIISKNGTFDAIFERFHGENLRRATLEKRRIIYLENPNLPSSASFDYETLFGNSLTLK